MKRLLPLVTLAFGLSFVLGAKFWEKKPYTEWSERDAWSILNRSPWTGRISVWARVSSRSTRVDISGGSDRTDHKDLEAATNSDQAASRRLEQLDTGDSDTITYLIRFQLSAPVRRALARLTLLGMEANSGGSLQDRQMVDKFAQTSPLENNIIVSVCTEDGRAPAALEGVTQEQFMEYTYLFLKKSKRKLGLEQYYSPARAKRMGLGSSGLFLFPRTEGGKELVTLAEKEIHFETYLGKKLKIKKKFKLKKMMFDNKLAL